MLIVSIVGSILYLSVVFFTLRVAGKIASCVVAFLGVLLASGISPVLLLQTFLVLCGCLVCTLLPTRLRTDIAVAIGLTLIAYTGAAAAGVRKIGRVQAARAAHPYQSLADRLPPKTVGAATSPQFMENRLQDMESKLDRWSYHRRERALESLHQESAARFALLEGFGPIRMAYWSRNPENYVDVPAVDPIPLQTLPPPEEYRPDQSPEPADPEAPRTMLPSKDTLTEMHATSYVDFVNREGFGHVIDTEHVAGFQPHQFRKMPLANTGFGKDWRIVRLELIGLLRHEHPVAYVSEHLPRMDELQSAPTRSLNAFETRSLDRIRAGEEVCTEETEDRILMFGSLRAVRQCVECHRTSRGELLGAFSYELRRAKPSKNQSEMPTPRT